MNIGTDFPNCVVCGDAVYLGVHLCGGSDPVCTWCAHDGRSRCDECDWVQSKQYHVVLCVTVEGDETDNPTVVSVDIDDNPFTSGGDVWDEEEREWGDGVEQAWHVVDEAVRSRIHSSVFEANPFVVTIEPDADGAPQHIASLFSDFTVELRQKGKAITKGVLSSHHFDGDVVTITPTGDDGMPCGEPIHFDIFDNVFDEIRYL